MLMINQVVFGLGRFVLGASAGRMGVWTQGCSLRKCPGCTSMHTWSPQEGRLVDGARLVRLAQAQDRRPTGLTVSGGEPTDQAAGVIALIEAFRSAFPGTEVVLYSGLRWSALAARHPALVHLLDVAVTGPYARTAAANPLAGSANQDVKLLTPLAGDLYRDWERWPSHTLQVGAGTNSRVITVGIPDTRRMERAAKSTGARNVSWDRSLKGGTA